MARSTYIYIIYSIWDNSIVAPFTVKYEMIDWFKDNCIEPKYDYNDYYEIYRFCDGTNKGTRINIEDIL